MDKPTIDAKNNVLVKIKAAGICGSDVGIYHGTNAAATYPRVIGHEIVGVVEEIGGNAKKIKVGDRVIVDQVTACGTCYACRKGRPNVCEHLQVRGVHIDGGYREYMAVPESDVYVLPDSLSYQDAVMIEPTTIAVQACSRAQLECEDTVMIIGSRRSGQLHAAHRQAVQPPQGHRRRRHRRAPSWRLPCRTALPTPSTPRPEGCRHPPRLRS